MVAAGMAALLFDLRPNRVRAPTLLIVGGDGEPVLTWNRDAARRNSGPVETAVIPGATHLRGARSLAGGDPAGRRMVRQATSWSRLTVRIARPAPCAEAAGVGKELQHLRGHGCKGMILSGIMLDAPLQSFCKASRAKLASQCSPI